MALGMLAFVISSMITVMFLSSNILVIDETICSLVDLLNLGCHFIGMFTFFAKFKCGNK